MVYVKSNEKFSFLCLAYLFIMVFGIGTDIIEVKRIAESICSESFIKRIFTENEILYCNNKNVTKAQSYAARFAAKEAFLKAYSPPYLGFKEIEILSRKNNKPYIRILKNKSSRELKNCFVSITHEQELAIAIVIILFDA